jgi:hypothetical protein
MDGYEVINSLKSNDDTKNIPVIFITAKTDTEDETKGFRLGAADYITKPINPAIVLARVAVHLKVGEQKKILLEQNEKLHQVNRILLNKMMRINREEAKKTNYEEEQIVVQKQNFADYFLDDHRNDLYDAEDDIDSIVNLILLKNRFDIAMFEKFGMLLEKYASILILYPVFNELGEQMLEFAKNISKDKNPTEQNIKFALACLESLIYTMKSWREQVFGNNIEYANAFDNSMIADMNTISMALDNSLENINSEIEFF